MSTQATATTEVPASTAPISQPEAQSPTSSSSGSDIPNPKFKTALCKNYINSTCNRPTTCHFAHGSEELRAVSENSGFFEEVEKPTGDYLNKWPTTIPPNYKTTLCKFFELVGTCKYDQNCNFAHGDEEKRQLSENIQTQLKTARNNNKHINNTVGQKNAQQTLAQQQQMQQAFLQHYMMQMLLSQQYNYIIDVCARIKKSSKADDAYVKKTLSDIKKLANDSKLKQALQQLKKLCSRKDANDSQKQILGEIENYLQNSESNGAPVAN